MAQQTKQPAQYYDHHHNLWQEILTRAKIEGIFTQEEFFDIIDEVIEEHREEGYLSDDEDIEYLRSALRDRWKEIKEKL